MNKLLLFHLLFFLSALSWGQDLDSTFVQTTSESLLNRKINFTHPKESLDSVLITLSAEQQIKISYSYDKTKGIIIQPHSYTSESLSSVLSTVLSNTGLNFMVVGKIIVIFPEEKKKEPIKEEAKDSVKAVLPPTTPKVSNHIYSPSNNLDKLPMSERRKIRKLYEEELKWSLRYRKFGNKKEQDTATTEEEEKNKKEVKKILLKNKEKPLYPFYISGQMAFVNYSPKIEEQSTVSWESDIHFASTAPSKFRPTFTLGYMNRFMKLGLGVGFQKFSFSGSGTKTIPKGKSGKSETVLINFSDTYSVTSIPIELMFFKRWTKVYAGIGGKFEMGFIKAVTVTNDKYKDYLSKLDDKANYYEYYNQFIWSNSFKAEAGYWIHPKFAAAMDVQYNLYWKPLTQNYFYNLYPNSVMVELSLLYFFNKPDFNKYN